MAYPVVLYFYLLQFSPVFLILIFILYSFILQFYGLYFLGSPQNLCRMRWSRKLYTHIQTYIMWVLYQGLLKQPKGKAKDANFRHQNWLKDQMMFVVDRVILAITCLGEALIFLLKEQSCLLSLDQSWMVKKSITQNSRLRNSRPDPFTLLLWIIGLNTLSESQLPNLYKSFKKYFLC